MNKILRQLIRETLLTEIEYAGSDIEYRARIEKDSLFQTPKVSVDAIIGSRRVGKLRLGHVKVRYQKTIADEVPRCYSDIQALESQGMTANQYWFVDNVEVADDLRGMGIGKGIYRAGLEKIRQVPGGPHIVMPANCTGWIGTSQEARRVWDSIAPEYPHSGRVIYLE